MKKVILEEIENMRYLLGYQRGVVISEQETTKTMGTNIDSGNLANLNPDVANAMKQAQNMLGGQSVLPNVTTGVPATGAPATGAPATGVPATGAPATGAPATGAPATPVTPINIGVKYPSIEELQNTLITKFQSGLNKDGKYGPKTAASVLAALQKVPTNNAETKTPENPVVGDASSDAIKKTAEANASTNVVANNDQNKNTQPTVGGSNFAEIDGSEFA